MKKYLKILFTGLLVILIGGCQKQGPIELIDSIDDSNIIEISAVSTPVDSTFEPVAFDTSGLLNPHKFYGKLVFRAIRYERAFKSDSVILAEGIFYDKSAPIIQHGRVITYASYDLGNLSVNSNKLTKIPRKLSPLIRDPMGFRYHAVLPYQFSINNKWTASGANPIDSFSVPFTFPSEIKVLNLKPSIVRIGEPLNIKWKCANPIVHLVISAEDEFLPDRIIKPLLHLKIKNTKNGVTIPPKILGLIPWNRHQKFIFTFTSENRIETNISGYPDPVLVHSASIHNIVVGLRQ